MSRNQKYRKLLKLYESEKESDLVLFLDKIYTMKKYQIESFIQWVESNIHSWAMRESLIGSLQGRLYDIVD